MSLLYKLEYQDNFTDLEKGIANYILDHKDNIIDLKITDLAEITFTSPQPYHVFVRRLVKKVSMIFAFILLHRLLESINHKLTIIDLS